MNAKQLFFILVIIGIFSIGGFLIYKYALRPLITFEIYLTPLSSFADSTEQIGIKNNIVDKLGDTAERVIIKVYNSKKGTWLDRADYKLPTGLMQEGTLQRINKNHLDSIDLDFPLEASLEQTESIFNLISDIESEEDLNKIVVLTGKTPDCLPNDLVTKINNSFKEVKSGITINWNLKSNKSHPDNIIRDHLDSLYNLNDNHILTDRNTCSDDTLNTELILFSSIDSLKTNSFIKGLIEKNHSYYNITVVTADKTVNKIHHITDLANNKKLYNFIINASSSDIKQSRFSFDYVVKKFENDSTDTNHDIYLLGKLPYTNQKFVDISPLKGKDNLNFFVDLSSTNKYIDANKIIINAFKSQQLNIQKYN